VLADKSARWLLYRGKDVKAEKALNKIHGQALHHEMIVQEQLAILNKSREEEKESSSSQSKWSDLWSKFIVVNHSGQG
jgi:SP family sugar:H+ symporter-like MFS transporter